MFHSFYSFILFLFFLLYFSSFFSFLLLVLTGDAEEANACKIIVRALGNTIWDKTFLQENVLEQNKSTELNLNGFR